MKHDVDVFLAVSIAATAAAVAVALVSPRNAYAESTAEYTTPFTSTRSRAEVQAELMGGSELLRTGSSEWAMQHNEPMALKSDETREHARAEYKFARQEVTAVTEEDSGSTYFQRQAMRVKASATMGGPAR
jgi:hypothetical protein